MSYYRPLPGPGEPDEFDFGQHGPHAWQPPRVSRWAEDSPLAPLPFSSKDAAVTPAEVDPSAETDPIDEPASLRSSMLMEIEAALQAEDSEIACFHVTLANVYARRLVALGTAGADDPAQD